MPGLNNLGAPSKDQNRQEANVRRDRAVPVQGLASQSPVTRAMSVAHNCLSKPLGAQKSIGSGISTRSAIASGKAEMPNAAARHRADDLIKM